MTLNVVFIQFDKWSGVLCGALISSCWVEVMKVVSDVLLHKILILGTFFVLCYSPHSLVKAARDKLCAHVSVSVWDIIYLGPSLPLQKWSDLIR